jgi:glycosidase
VSQRKDTDIILNAITFLYGDERAPDIHARLENILGNFRSSHPSPSVMGKLLTEQDSMLITYADMVLEPGTLPLVTLTDFLITHLKDVVSAVHLLPFFPYSSDDGFSVIDYRQVDPQLGTWDEIRRLQQYFKLMFDGVINHVSSQSQWFQGFLHGDPAYQDWFIVVEGEPDLSEVVRPRTLPLLTHVETLHGRKAVWTTFSADQIDLNYHNPDVLLEIIDTLLFYVSQGAEFIRLDAVAYLWKEIGTTCIHLPQTHCIIQLLRTILDRVAPHVKLITETNVPHSDNISYFGNGYNEAQLVYNFALPPLVLHTLQSGDARTLSEWSASLSLPSDRSTFFNFLASHDGIGLNPVRGILTDSEIDTLVVCTLEHGGAVSYKRNPDGSQSPYELNINYLDALSNPEEQVSLQTQVDRFMVAQAIMLALTGLPGIYFHSLFGSRGWPEGIRLTGHNRAINRQKLERTSLERELSDPRSLRHQIFSRYKHLLRVRSSCHAFDPYGAQQVLDCGRSVFALSRTSPRGEQVLCLHNVTNRHQTVHLPEDFQAFTDVLAHSNRQVTSPVELAPYQVRWLKIEENHALPY